MDHQEPANGSHLELFTTSRAGLEVGIPCWCALARNHSYEEWQDAGRPDPRPPLASQPRRRPTPDQ